MIYQQFNDGSMNENDIVEFIDKSGKSESETVLINLLHTFLSKSLSILESNFFYFLDNNKPVLIVNSGTSTILQNKISNFEEDGILDFVIVQGKCFIVPDLSGNTNSTDSYIFCPFKFEDNFLIFAAISTNELNFFSDNHKLFIERMVQVAGLRLNAFIQFQEQRKLKQLIFDLNERITSIERFGTLGDITNSIIAEFSNPIQIINANLELISNGIGDSNRRLQIINEQFKIVNDIYKRLNSVLSLKADDGSYENIDLISLIKGIIYISSNKLQRDGIKIVYESELEQAEFSGFKNQFEQVLISLIENAKSTMPEGGVINIGIFRNLKSKVNIVISDTGVGFSESEINDFFNIDFTNKSKGSVGLYYIQNIIKEHKGKIIVSSEIGKGTTYKITLPTIKQK